MPWPVAAAALLAFALPLLLYDRWWVWPVAFAGGVIVLGYLFIRAIRPGSPRVDQPG
jgi:hypothetical protein